jgi:hypothetical protein
VRVPRGLICHQARAARVERRLARRGWSGPAAGCTTRRIAVAVAMVPVLLGGLVVLAVIATGVALARLIGERHR